MGYAPFASKQVTISDPNSGIDLTGYLTLSYPANPETPDKLCLFSERPEPDPTTTELWSLPFDKISKAVSLGLFIKTHFIILTDRTRIKVSGRPGQFWSILRFELDRRKENASLKPLTPCDEPNPASE
ncbi:MAG: hypothetical protein ACYS18_04460 [Planctomycetota bacterium]